MSERYTMAVDAGTGSCRAVLFNTRGSQVAIGQREWTHREAPNAPGSRVFDTGGNWPLICECIREVLSTSGVSPGVVAAVSATSIREGMVLYDSAGREVWACPNVDSRAIDEAGELVRTGAAREIYFHGGDWVSITAPSRFLWLAKHEPKIFAAVAHMSMLSDWILYRLSGQLVTDPSIGSSSAMFDLDRRTWSDRAIEICGLDRGVFPEVVESGNVIGGVTRVAAEETGLTEGTPVVVGGADTQLGLLGIGGVAKGFLAIIGGSFWQTTVLSDMPLIDPKCRLRTLCHSTAGLWMVEGIGFYSGLTMRWFRDAFCQRDKEQAAREGVDVYTLLEAEAASVPPGSNGVIPIFSNVMNAQRWVHASPSLLQFDIDHPERSGKKECYRAIQEGAAYVAYGHLQIIEELAERAYDEVVFTGGASQGGLWPQILADVLGLVVRVPMVKESTALGASIYAGLGVGLYDDLSDAVKSSVRMEKVCEPSESAHERYVELFGQWREIYARQLALSDEGLLRPLWKAAGASAKDPGVEDEACGSEI